MNELNWNKLTFGKYSMKEILDAVRDKEWQVTRRVLKGKPLEEKYTILRAFLEMRDYSLLSKICVTNYVNALRRAGMVAPKAE